MTEQPLPRQEFEESLSNKDEEIDLIELSLRIAAEEYPNLNIRKYAGLLDSMAAELSDRLGPQRNSRDMIKVLNTFLFDEKKFGGNVTEYYDPRNSFLNDVLDRRTGIPITLSLIYMELARRVGLSLLGVGMPGHFLLRFDGSETFFIDSFNLGEILDEEGCRRRFDEFYRGRMEFRSQFLEPVTKRQIVFRLLANPKGIYLGSQGYARAPKIIELMLIVNPSSLLEIRDRGLAYHQLQRNREAIQDLEKYVGLVEDVEEREVIGRYLQDLKSYVDKQRMYV